MPTAAAFLLIACAAIVAAWSWLGAAVPLPPSPLAGGSKLHCVSYAPFRGNQSPLGPDVPIDPRQIEEDLVQLKRITDCVRTYSVDHGLDQIPGIAQRHGIKVLQGLWLSSLPDLSRQQIQGAVALARKFPDVITGVVVGNEVLLRGEMAAPELARTIREVKAQVPVPVTYADVWEFWLRHRDIASAVDFITIHILPYWEDFPIPARDAARHVDTIRQRIVEAFPGREILVGEFGWPSAGRMREGALPSPINQAGALTEVLAAAGRRGYRVNLIEAYDQPWKRQLEGTVGGHWGLYDAYRREAKFAWGGTVSNHPRWRWQAGAGVLLAVLVFAAAVVTPRGAPMPRGALLRVGVIATVAGALIGWTIESIPLESLTVGDWARSLAWGVAAVAGPLTVATAVAAGTPVPSFAAVLGPRPQQRQGRLGLALGALMLLLMVLAVQAALGLVFDPRYRDFPFAPLTGAVVPFMVLARWRPQLRQAPAAETATAVTLVLAAAYIVLNEGLANWQAGWLCAGLVALAVTLLQARDAS